MGKFQRKPLQAYITVQGREGKLQHETPGKLARDDQPAIGSLYYLLADHLGSTSLVVKDVITGTWADDVASETSYTPCPLRFTAGVLREGETRSSSGTSLTNYKYTGQREESSFGLYFFNARWYDSYLNHFTQPDTIVPDPANPQDWNRYSYARYNPIRYNDPTGHISCDDIDDDGNCINFELSIKRLRNDLKRFVAPKKVHQDDTIWLGNWLAPGEAKLFESSFKGGPFDYDNASLLKMAGIIWNADKTTGELFYDYDPKGEMNNSPSGAFHHAYWAALITREYGVDFAKQFLYAHETRPTSIREETFMDLHNNRVGLEISLANPNATDIELQKAIIQSLNNGELYVWDGKNINFSGALCPNCDWRVEVPNP